MQSLEQVFLTVDSSFESLNSILKVIVNSSTYCLVE